MDSAYLFNAQIQWYLASYDMCMKTLDGNNRGGMNISIHSNS